jgi:hypothetical protein|tara:strand:+ start:13391 stop:13885 length:495 start_codon:yes stop_codon:yes gene_type:complete
MFIQAKLVPKSYKPLQLEKGMLFSTIKDSTIQIHELTYVPRDTDIYLELNGYPIELYIVYEGNLNLKEFEILATPEQIGWFDQGNDSDELSDITIKQINNIFSNYDGYLAIEIDFQSQQPNLYDNKVTIRYIDHNDDEQIDEEFDQKVREYVWNTYGMLLPDKN